MLAVPPAAGTIQMSGLPARVDTNAIRVPSGDQVGCRSDAGSVVTRVGDPPSLGSVHKSPLAPNTKRVPSGDHFKSWMSYGRSAIRRASPPLAAATQIVEPIA